MDSVLFNVILLSHHDDDTFTAAIAGTTFDKTFFGDIILARLLDVILISSPSVASISSEFLTFDQ
jgi:hypothetical protein